MHATRDKGLLERVAYRPPAAYSLDVEVVPMSELRRRAGREHMRATHRIEFHALFCVTRGRCTQAIDFKTYRCRPGSVLTLRPNQAQRFVGPPNWDGWVVIFRPEFLLPLQNTASLADLRMVGSLEELPEHLVLAPADRRGVVQAIAQMHADAAREIASETLHALLRHQLYALLLRLQLAHGERAGQARLAAANLQRFKRFRQFLETHFAREHQVAAYASLVGCSQKSLNRATQEVAGLTAKACIAARINLEAKRLLAHTALPIARIAEQVGFDEATNFVKFFKRETGCSPSEFRRRQGGRVDAP